MSRFLKAASDGFFVKLKKLSGLQISVSLEVVVNNYLAVFLRQGMERLSNDFVQL